MKKIIGLQIFLLLTLSVHLLNAQESSRYLSPIFSTVDVQRDVVYGTNISVLTGTPAETDLLMDVYTPSGDTVMNRPVWIILHTGTFLPPLFNQQVTGSRTDSTVVNICKRLAALGYVAVAATYRAGWLATSLDQDIRIGSLLTAAYRGIQDTRTCIRFLRKSSAEEDNPYGIDASKIGVWGIGTGGYLSMGAATLDDPEEVQIEKFINTMTGQSYADTALLGNFDGTSAGQISIPNHPGYSSDFSIAVNLGGAMGDISWLDGESSEPAIVGFHATTDRFAPFGIADVFAPGETPLLVIPTAAGARIVIDSANNLGNNNVLDLVPAELDPLGPRIQELKEVDVTVALPPGGMLKAGTDHFYPFITQGAEGSPWDWWSFEDLQVVVAGTNALLGTEFNADTLHRDGLLTNPDMSAEKGNRYLDTIFMVTVPRAYYAFGLDTVSTSLPSLSKEDVELSLSPNPSTNSIEIRSSISTPMEQVRFLDIAGRVVLERRNIGSNYTRIDHRQLTPGTYFAQIHFENGLITQKIILQ